MSEAAVSKLLVFYFWSFVDKPSQKGFMPAQIEAPPVCLMCSEQTWKDPDIAHTCSVGFESVQIKPYQRVQNVQQTCRLFQDRLALSFDVTCGQPEEQDSQTSFLCVHNHIPGIFKGFRANYIQISKSCQTFKIAVTLIKILVQRQLRNTVVAN